MKRQRTDGGPPTEGVNADAPSATAAGVEDLLQNESPAFDKQLVEFKAKKFEKMDNFLSSRNQMLAKLDQLRKEVDYFLWKLWAVLLPLWTRRRHRLHSGRTRNLRTHA